MWRIPKSRLKRGALLLFLTSTFLLGPFLNHPSKFDICWLVLALSAILLYGLSDYLKKEKRNVSAFLLCSSIGCTGLLIVAWHFWPEERSRMIGINGDPLLSSDARLDLTGGYSTDRHPLAQEKNWNSTSNIQTAAHSEQWTFVMLVRSASLITN
jgi:hypothetical protein